MHFIWVVLGQSMAVEPLKVGFIGVRLECGFRFPIRHRKRHRFTIRLSPSLGCPVVLCTLHDKMQAMQVITMELPAYKDLT